MNNLVNAAGWTLIHFLWQGALLGLAAAALLKLMRGASAGARYAVACASLLACLLLPAAEFASAVQASPNSWQALLAAPNNEAYAHSELLTDIDNRLPLLVAAWLACVAALALRSAFGLAWIARARSTGARNAHWQQRLSRLAASLGIGRDVGLRIVETLASPITAGWWRPVVLVPAALVARMPPELLEALLAHELGHVRRHDYLVNLVQNVIEALLFYHPAVWWISRRIRHEREQIADDFAARRLGEPRRLARALSELERLQFSSHHLAQAAAGGDLMARIRRLVRPDPQALDWRAAIPVLGLVLACAVSAHALATRDAPVVRTAGLTRSAVADFSTCRKPQYPQADIAASHEGTVTLNFRLDASGFVTDSTILRSSGYASMDEAARSALHLCRFAPALRDGQPVPTWQPVQYVWTLA